MVQDRRETGFGAVRETIMNRPLGASTLPARIIGGKTTEGKCQMCGKTGRMYESTDMHETNAICPACAQAEKMVACGLCGDVRYPDNMDELDSTRYQSYGRKYCVGCIEEAAERAGR
jgi:hypothetical protein